MSKEDLKTIAIAELDNNPELFCTMVEELDNAIGFADGFRCYDMCDLDDFYYYKKASELISDLTEDFNINDNYFYFSIYGLESCDDKYEFYTDHTDSDEVLDNVLNEYYHIWIPVSPFKDMVYDIIIAEDEESEEE